MKDADCLFCKIIDCEVPSEKVFEDDAYNGSYRLIFNTGEDAGQTVFHVHAHVLTGEPMEE